MILIGSKAIIHHYPDFPRKANDIDYVMNEYEHFGCIKVPGTEYIKNKVLTDLIRTDFDQIHILEPHLLCTLKASHLFWNIKWDKHMYDLQFLLKKGNKIDEPLFWKLYEHWNEYHGANKRSDLKMSKEDFFTNKVNYDTLEHDETHKLINPNPIYARILKEGAEVDLDENKYKLLSKSDKLDLVREEVMVMAYERFDKLDYRFAYAKMLKKFIIAHAPKFTLIDILENYIELHRPPKFNFIKHIKNNIC